MTENHTLPRPAAGRSVPLRFAVALALAFAAIAVLLPHSADAQQRRGGAGMGGALANPAFLLWAAVDSRFEVLTEELELTESQQESATELVATLREENETALESYRELMTQMRNRMGGAGAGRSGGQRRAGGGMPGGGGQLRETMAELQPVLEGFRTDFHALLTEDQVEKLDEITRRRPRGR